jgi:Uma2 family endonuclease
VRPMSLAARDRPRRMTADEFFATTDELPHAQLIDGELVVPMSSPTGRHDDVVVTLTHLFRLHRREHPDAGYVGINGDVPVDQGNVFQPDVYWVPEDQRIIDTGRLPAPPPLVAEVRSPTTWSDDRGRKLRGYERAGVAEVWLVDTAARTITAHRRSEGSATFDLVEVLGATDTLTTPLIPGWVVDLAEVFRRERGSGTG